MWSQELIKLSLQGFSKLKKLVGSPPPKISDFSKVGGDKGETFFGQNKYNFMGPNLGGPNS